MRLPSVLPTLLLAAAGLSPQARAQVDLAALERSLAGPPTEVLVLGSTHLSGMPADFDPARLAPVLERLRRFRPDIVAIEALSGESCDLLARHPTVYPGVVDDYCPETAAARAATGLGPVEALAEAHRLLADWPSAPAAAQRRHLAAVLLAAGEPASALVQWLQLPAAERRAGDGLDAALVAQLQRSEHARDESFQIAARLAAELGHARVHAMDDHTADRVLAQAGSGLQDTMQAIWRTPDAAADAVRRRVAALEAAGDMLALYRYHNGAEYLETALRTDFGAALGDPTPERYGRQYVGWWETRNLRMVASLREAFAGRPGARVLAVVGSSHKPYFDDYLRRMHAVRVVDAGAVLAGD